MVAAECAATMGFGAQSRRDWLLKRPLRAFRTGSCYFNNTGEIPGRSVETARDIIIRSPVVMTKSRREQLGGFRFEQFVKSAPGLPLAGGAMNAKFDECRPESVLLSAWLCAKNIPVRTLDGVVAQLVERLVRNEKVAGSIPVGSTIQ